MCTGEVCVPDPVCEAANAAKAAADATAKATADAATAAANAAKATADKAAADAANAVGKGIKKVVPGFRRRLQGASHPYRYTYSYGVRGADHSHGSSSTRRLLSPRLLGLRLRVTPLGGIRHTSTPIGRERGLERGLAGCAEVCTPDVCVPPTKICLSVEKVLDGVSGVMKVRGVNIGP